MNKTSEVSAEIKGNITIEIPIDDSLFVSFQIIQLLIYFFLNMCSVFCYYYCHLRSNYNFYILKSYLSI